MPIVHIHERSSIAIGRTMSSAHRASKKAKHPKPAPTPPLSNASERESHHHHRKSKPLLEPHRLCHQKHQQTDHHTSCHIQPTLPRLLRSPIPTPPTKPSTINPHPPNPLPSLLTPSINPSTPSSDIKLASVANDGVSGAKSS